MENIQRSKSQERHTRAKMERIKTKGAQLNHMNELDLNAQISLNKEGQKQAAKLSRKLEFGFKFKAEYKKHGYQGVKDIFWNPNSK